MMIFPRSVRRPTTAAVALLAVFTVMATSSPALAAKAAAAPAIENSATPARGEGVLRLVEQWRAGGEDDEIYFGDIERVRVDDLGNVYVLDREQSRLHVYGPGGEHLRELTREGEGPGEVRQPYDFCFLDDGTIAFCQRYNGKIVRVERNGDPAGNWDLMQLYHSINTLMCRGGTLSIVGQYGDHRPAGQTQHFVAAVHEADGSRRAILEERTNELDYADFVLREAGSHCARQSLIALGPDGRVYAAGDRDDYRVSVYAPDGSLERIIEREFEITPRTKLEKKRIEADIFDSVRNVNLEKKIVVSASEPVIEYLAVDARGRLWVLHQQSDTGLPEGAMVAFDVFDAAGVYDSRVVVFCDGDAENDHLRMLSDGRFALLKWSVGGSRVLEDDVEVGSPELVILAAAD